MRKRLFNWQNQRFVYLGLEAQPGPSLALQSRALFERTGVELANLGLSLHTNVVRTRIFARTRDARNAASDARAAALKGQSRAAGSSYVSAAHFFSAADVGLDIFAMRQPADGAARMVTDYEPPANFIRHLVWAPMVFLAGMTSELPTLKAQYQDVLTRAGALLDECGCQWRNVVRVSFFLHKDHDPNELLSGVAEFAPVPLADAEIEFVEGFSRLGKLVEIEITARKD